VAELNALFSRYGTLSQLLLPPSKSVALVCFVEESEARIAFKAVAYKNYRHVPIYLEWAPIGVVQAGASLSSAAAKDAERDKSLEVLDEDEMQSFTLYVKNLSFETTEGGLREFASRKCASGLRAVSIPKKVKNGNKLSLGFGFLEYDSHENAQNAIKALQGSHLDGHTLDVKASNKRLSTPPSAVVSTKDASAKPTCKLLVRNVAFQANARELRKLFESFGQVKKIRMPKKFDGSHRGFAFIDFLTKKEAEAAMKALANSHLYGRHLVLEWAKEDAENLESLREKATADLAVVQEQRKRTKHNEGDEQYDNFESF
jgi:multiple RNA-binding domain-containing protein 1